HAQRTEDIGAGEPVVRCEAVARSSSDRRSSFLTATPGNPSEDQRLPRGTGSDPVRIDRNRRAVRGENTYATGERRGFDVVSKLIEPGIVPLGLEDADHDHSLLVGVSTAIGGFLPDAGFGS